MELLEQFGIDAGYLCIGLTVFSLFLFILILMLSARQNKLMKKYRNFMKGDKDVVTMEQLIESRLDDMERLDEKSDALAKKIMEMEDVLLGTYQKAAIIKYDAFRGMGGNLSFVLAMLDRNNNGFLLNSMHSKESCYTYIKDVVKGKAKVELSEEEKAALQEAVSQN
jgi:hypothetical protein